jgi:HEXXH motif-containing protein
LLTTHLLPEATFRALAEGADRPDTIRLLRDAQLSKHQMLLYAIASAASGADPGPTAFRAGYDLLARMQATEPAAGHWLFSLPHLGGWAHDCLIHLEQGTAADFGHFACLAAAAAVRTGTPFELDVPVRDGRVRLPGLGSVHADDQRAWIRLRCDGDVLIAGDHLVGDWRLLVPDDGSAAAMPRWSGTPLIRVAADGLAWNVLLETGDRYLDRYTLPMSTRLSADELRGWRHRTQSAWAVLVGHHRWAAKPIADGISAMVPLTPRSDTDMVSVTTPAAFGAFATSWPPDPVTMAETLVHEFQHVKLGGLIDLVPLTRPGGEKVYAAWRQDPRPPGGLLQGVYAHLGIARFWHEQRHAETDPDDILRAQVLFARWRATIDRTAETLLRTGSLTSAGVRFVGMLRAQGQDLDTEPVPGDAADIAREVALDHRLTWQVRHLAIDAADVARLAAAYRRGAAAQDQAEPRTWIEEDVRKVDSTVRSRLLNLRYLAPARYRELCADGTLALSEADRLLVNQSASAAVQAYREQVIASAEPRPDAWIGLALALHRLPPSPLQAVLDTRLPLVLEVHDCLGGRIDPLDLASWFA